MTSGATITAAMEQGDHVANLNGLQAWFKVRGSGPVCLFPTPGWGASSDLYFETLKPLEHWFTMVYLDTRGCGRSALGLPDEAYRLTAFMSDLEELRKLLGEEKVWVMGHSLGGWLAQEFAVRHSRSCAGLVLLNSTAAVDAEGRADQEARIARRAGEPWFPAAYEALRSDEDIGSDAEFKAHLGKILPFYFHDVSKYEPEAFASETYAVEAYTTMVINEDELQRGALDRLHQLDVPAVIVVGDDDFICSPVQAMRIHLRLPGSKLIVVPESGHFPWLEQPDAFFSNLEAALQHVAAFSAELPA